MRHLHLRSAACIAALLMAVPTAVTAQGTLGTLTGAIDAPSRTIGEVVLSGDRLQTDANDRLMLSLQLARGVLCVAPESDITLISIDSSNRIQIDAGMVRLYYHALQPGQAFELSTPLGSMTLSGSIVWAGHDPAANVTVFAVEDTNGSIAPKTGTPFGLNAGQMVRLTATGPGEPASLGDQQVQDWQRQLQLSELMMSQLVREFDSRIELGIREAATEESIRQVAQDVIAAVERFAPRTSNQRLIDVPGLGGASADLATVAQGEAAAPPPPPDFVNAQDVNPTEIPLAPGNGGIIGIDQLNPVTDLTSGVVQLGQDNPAGRSINTTAKTASKVSRPVNPASSKGTSAVARWLSRFERTTTAARVGPVARPHQPFGTTAEPRVNRTTPIRVQR